MENFEGRLAVVTGGGSGMGRELVRQLAAAGCHVASCDVVMDNLAATARLVADESPAVRMTTHECDVADEAAVLGFRDEVLAAHDTDHVHLLFNNAGISGGGSFLTDPREAWDRTFSITWGGVYHCSRAFLPLIVAAEEGHIVNTSSVNGFWAKIGDRPHTAYSTAKFAVKGFTEALITDLEVNAPHVGVSLVMPGHIGTSIVENSARLGTNELSDAEMEMLDEVDRMFRDNAPMTAAEAATVILDAVREKRWRVLVGDDAARLDEVVRADPEATYERTMLEVLRR